ncbi:exported heme utilization-like protein [Caballeronia fortuita]|uniref:Exported heme utilization-like protein n=1 Tax=Caballeronia fortuita TaxID=1777138 RepID=A0A158A8R9_9BURK|nr:exported heme utilization-like protein [Caballeronia fortuita]
MQSIAPGWFNTRYPGQPGEASGDSGWGALFELNRPMDAGMTYLKTLTPYVMMDAARVFLHGGTASPRRLS